MARHPNVFPDGKVCISILHPPGEDIYNPQESASERWSPVHTVGVVVGGLGVAGCKAAEGWLGVPVESARRAAPNV